MDTLTEGKVLLDGKEISSYGKKQLTDYRRYDIGFVFQFYNLVGNLTALENVELASQICSDPLDAGQVLADVGLADRGIELPCAAFRRGTAACGDRPCPCQKSKAFCCAMNQPARWITIQVRQC